MPKNGLQAKAFGLVKEFFHNLPVETTGHQRAAAHQYPLVLPVLRDAACNAGNG